MAQKFGKLKIIITLKFVSIKENTHYTQETSHAEGAVNADKCIWLHFFHQSTNDIRPQQCIWQQNHANVYILFLEYHTCLNTTKQILECQNTNFPVSISQMSSNSSSNLSSGCCSQQRERRQTYQILLSAWSRLFNKIILFRHPSQHRHRRPLRGPAKQCRSCKC